MKTQDKKSESEKTEWIEKMMQEGSATNALEGMDDIIKDIDYLREEMLSLKRQIAESFENDEPEKAIENCSSVIHHLSKNASLGRPDLLALNMVKIARSFKIEL